MSRWALEQMPERFPFIGLVDEWYEARPLRVGKTYFVARARTPWALLLNEKDAWGEHARWALHMSLKYHRTPTWKFWRIEDSAFDMRVFELSWLDRALGWLLTAAAIWKAVRR